MENEEVIIGVFNTYNFAMRSIIDFVAVVILVALIYYPKHRNKDIIFTFILFNFVNFIK